MTKNGCFTLTDLFSENKLKGWRLVFPAKTEENAVRKLFVAHCI